MQDEIKRQEREKIKEQRREDGGLLEMLRRDSGDCPRLSLSLMQIIRSHN